MTVRFEMSSLSNHQKSKVKYFGYFAVLTALLGFVRGFRNVTSLVNMISEINNYLIPMFLVALGVLLIRSKKELF